MLHFITILHQFIFTFTLSLSLTNTWMSLWNLHLPTSNHGVTCNNAETFTLTTITLYSFLICFPQPFIPFPYILSSTVHAMFFVLLSLLFLLHFFSISFIFLSPLTSTLNLWIAAASKGMKGNRLPRQPLTLVTGVWSFNAHLRSDNSIKGGRNLVRMWSLSAQESGIQIADNCSRLTAFRFRLSEPPSAPRHYPPHLTGS